MTGHQLKAFESRIHNLPCWTGPVDITPLSGGLMNETFLVVDPAGKHVVRFGEDLPYHHVVREREVMVARAAYAAAVGPQVEYAQPGIMVSAYIDARPCDAAAIRDNRGRVAKLIRRFHERMPREVTGPPAMFWVFHAIRHYVRMLEQTRSRMTAEIPYYLALAEEFEEAQTPLPIVFGHNDLLPENVLDDGQRLWLVDFEFAGFNTALFDVAGLASNAEMAEEEAEDLISSYFGYRPDRAILRAYTALQCASLLREAMWSMVSELHLPVTGIDYADYANLNLCRLRTAMAAYQQRYG